MVINSCQFLHVHREIENRKPELGLEKKKGTAPLYFLVILRKRWRSKINWMASFRSRNMGHSSLRKKMLFQSRVYFLSLLVIRSASEYQPFMEEVVLEYSELVMIFNFAQRVVTLSNW